MSKASDELKDTPERDLFILYHMATSARFFKANNEKHVPKMRNTCVTLVREKMIRRCRNKLMIKYKI